MEIQLTADIKKLTRDLRGIQRKQIPVALKNALNDTAFDARKAIMLAMPTYLDRPRNTTVKSVQVEKSKKTNLVAKVGFPGKGFGRTRWKETPAEIMGRQIAGGIRRPVRKALAVPTRNFKTNKYGNIVRNKINTLLANTDKYFSGVPKGRTASAAGIWERIPPNKTKRKKGSRLRKKGAKQQTIRMVIAWEPSAHYRSGRFPLFRIVEKTVRQQFADRFRTALRNALATAR